MTGPDRPLLRQWAENVVDIARPDPARPLPAERLARLLREADFTSDSRRIVATASLSLAQWWGRIAFLAGAGSDPERLVESWFEDRTEPGRLLPWPVDPLERLSAEGALPSWLAGRWLARFGFDRALSLALAMNEPAPIVLRTNVARTDRPSLLSRLTTEGLRVQAGRGPAAIEVDGPANLFGTAAWREGLFEVQDAASQRVVDSLEIPPDACVVDLCAGSGGKTLALAAALRGRGRVIAIEPVSARIDDLRGRLRRSGLNGVEWRPGSALDASVVAGLEGRADVVLVDAPCSSLGVLRRSPGRKWTLEASDVTRGTGLQAALVAAGAALVKPGGTLAFATCSTEPEEGEAIATTFASSPPGHAFDDVGGWRTFPDLDGDDGFFFAAWRRRPGIPLSSA